MLHDGIHAGRTKGGYWKFWEEPAMTDDIASGAYSYLSGLPDVVALVGSWPADDPDNAGISWIFVRDILTRMEDISIVKGTQAVALVCINMGMSAAPIASSTARCQRLEVDIWVDPLRDAMGNISSPAETQNRGDHVFTVIDSHLHRTGVLDNTQQWGDLITAYSLRMTEPVWYPVPDGDGLIRGVCFFDVGTYGNWDPVVQVGGGDSGSGG